MPRDRLHRAMHELVRTNDIVLLGAIEALLASANLDCLIADQHISALEGMIGAFPRRLLVREADRMRARALLVGCGLRRRAARWLSRRPAAASARVGEDRLLDGRLVLRQPPQGPPRRQLMPCCSPPPCRIWGRGRCSTSAPASGTIGLAAALAAARRCAWFCWSAIPELAGACGKAMPALNGLAESRFAW